MKIIRKLQRLLLFHIKSDIIAFEFDNDDSLKGECKNEDYKKNGCIVRKI